MSKSRLVPPLPPPAPPYSAPPEVLAHSDQNKYNLENLINKRLKHLATVVPSNAPELDLPKPRRYRIDEYGERLSEASSSSVDTEAAAASTASTDSDTGNGRQERTLTGSRSAAASPMDLPIRYSKSCTACITQGFECSGHKPICSQCYYSSARYTRSIVRPRDYGVDAEGFHGSNRSPGVGQDLDMCSYPVEGPPLIPGSIYRQLTVAARKLDQMPPVMDEGLSRTELWGETIKSVAIAPIKEEDSNNYDEVDHGRLDDNGLEGEPLSTRRRNQDTKKSHRPHWEVFYRGIPNMDRNPATTVDYVLQSRSTVLPHKEREKILALDADLLTQGGNEKKRTRESEKDSQTRTDDPNVNTETAKKKVKGRYNPRPQIIDNFLQDSSNGDRVARHPTKAWMPMRGDDDMAFFKQPDGSHTEERVAVGLSRDTREALKSQDLRYGYHGRVSNILAIVTASAINDNEYWSGYHSKPKLLIEQEARLERSAIRAIPFGKIKSENREFGVKKRKAGLLPEHLPQYRAQMTQTFRPWVPKADDYVVPSACNLPETSFLRALHFYASYYYTHTYPCPDVFEAMDLTSHIALGMIIQETISDFAFKLGKEGQMEDCEVYAEKEEWARLRKEEQDRKTLEVPSTREGHSLDPLLDMDENGDAATSAEGDHSIPPETSQAGAWTRFSHRSGRLGREEEDQDEEDFDSDVDLQLSDDSLDDGDDDITTRVRPRKVRRAQAVDRDFWPPQSLEETMKWSENLSSGQRHWRVRQKNADPVAAPPREIRDKAPAVKAPRGRSRKSQETHTAATVEDDSQDDVDEDRREEDLEDQGDVRDVEGNVPDLSPAPPAKKTVAKQRSRPANKRKTRIEEGTVADLPPAPAADEIVIQQRSGPKDKRKTRMGKENVTDLPLAPPSPPAPPAPSAKAIATKQRSRAMVIKQWVGPKNKQKTQMEEGAVAVLPSAPPAKELVIKQWSFPANKRKTRMEEGTVADLFPAPQEIVVQQGGRHVHKRRTRMEENVPNLPPAPPAPAPATPAPAPAPAHPATKIALNKQEARMVVSDSDNESQENNTEEYDNSEKPAWEPVISSRFELLFDRKGRHEDEDQDQDEAEDEGMRVGAVISQVVQDSSSDEDEDVVGPSEAEESDEY